MSRPRPASLVIPISLLLMGTTDAKTIAATPENYRHQLSQLVPGSELRLGPGEYRDGLPLIGINGTPDARVVISGPNDGSEAVFAARAGHNTVSLVDVSYLTIRNLTLDGRGLPVDAVKAEGHAQWAHHVTLENLRIIGHGAHQQIVGISTKCPAWNWVVRGNEIIGAGTGMYFGNSDGSAPFVAATIEYNLVVDTVGYNLQIKHQAPRPAISGMPDSPQVTRIRYNVFSKTLSPPNETAARPNVLVGHWPLRGPGADDLYAIYGNFFYQNPTEALFQGEGRLAVYNNLFVNDTRDALRIQPHNDRPRFVRVLYNTVLTSAAGITLLRRREDPKPDVMVVGNAVFAGRPVSGYTSWGNLIGAYSAARRYFVNPYAPPPHLDLTLRQVVRLPIRTKLDDPNLPGLNRDFDGRVRQPGVPGAYGEPSGTAWWIPQRERRPASHAEYP